MTDALSMTQPMFYENNGIMGKAVPKIGRDMRNEFLHREAEYERQKHTEIQVIHDFMLP